MAVVIACAVAFTGAPTAALGSWWSYAGPRLASQTPSELPGNGDSWEPQLSDDGRFVEFGSDATNLDPRDRTVRGDGVQDVFFRDMKAVTCTLVADPPADSVEPTRGVRDGSISDDGRYVAFFTRKSLISSDTNGEQDLYVRDMRTGAYQRASVRGDAGLSRDNYEFQVSGNGRYVYFESHDAISPDDPDGDSGWDVFRWDRESGETSMVNLPRPGMTWPTGDSYCEQGCMSDDGRYCVFFSYADYDPADTDGNWDVYIRDMVAGTYTKVDVGITGFWPNNTRISGDGQYLAFEYSNEILPEETGSRDVFRWSLASGETTLVSLARVGGTETDRGSRDPAISDDGRYVAFYSGQDFVADDTNGDQDLYVKDIATGAYRRVVIADDPVASPGRGIWDVTMSGDGSTLAFGYILETQSSDALVDLHSDEELTASERAAFAPTAATQIYVVSLKRPFSAGATRTAGPDRYATAIEVSKQAFPDGARAVVIASGEDWPDALCGSALAGVLSAPVLLVPRDNLPQNVKTELARLGARDAYIVGGFSALAVGVEDALNGALAGSVQRISGTDRYGTSNAVAKAVIDLKGVDSYSGNALVATGGNFPDALAAAPLASGLDWPILLATPTTVTVPGPTARVAILGGTAAVPAALETSLKTKLGASNVTRLAGGNRYETATKVAAHGVANGLLWNGLGIGSGQTFPDALSGGTALGMQRTVMLLTPAASLDPTAAATLTANKSSISSVRFLGGTAAVSAAVANSVKSILGL